MLIQTISGIAGIVFEGIDTSVNFNAAGFRSANEFDVKVITFEEFE
jgi:hypothetical protein